MAMARELLTWLSRRKEQPGRFACKEKKRDWPNWVPEIGVRSCKAPDPELSFSINYVVPALSCSQTRKTLAPLTTFNYHINNAFPGNYLNYFFLFSRPPAPKEARLKMEAPLIQIVWCASSGCKTLTFNREINFPQSSLLNTIRGRVSAPRMPALGICSHVIRNKIKLSRSETFRFFIYVRNLLKRTIRA